MTGVSEYLTSGALDHPKGPKEDQSVAVGRQDGQGLPHLKRPWLIRKVRRRIRAQRVAARMNRAYLTSSTLHLKRLC